MPTLARRSQPATRDENGDGRIDARDDRIAAERSGADVQSRDLDGDGRAEVRDGAPATSEKERVTTGPVPAGPRPRSSGQATFGLILSVVAAAAVLTGVLAVPGLILAGFALLFSLGGMSATRRRHIAGRSDALIGVTISAATVVVAVLAMTGSLSWLHTDVEQVSRVRDWLDTNVPWLPKP